MATGGSATVAEEVLTVDGARANTTSLYDAGRSLDFAATFTADAFQHVGFGTDFNDGSVGDVQHGRRRARRACTRGHWCPAGRR